MRQTMKFPLGLSLLTLVFLPQTSFGQQKHDPRLSFIDTQSAGPEFAYVGEYQGNFCTSFCQTQWVGLQLYALGNGQFAGKQLQGGLPGTTWSCDGGIEVRGQINGDQLQLSGSTNSYEVDTQGRVTIRNSDGRVIGQLQKVNRQSQNLHACPPYGAEILFRDGKASGLKNAKVTDDGLLNVGFETEKAYQDFSLHVEFRLPYMPFARGQGRANSGVYLQSRYEVQILDSFGLEGKENECGALYRTRRPDFNMCLPPLTWQTYDIDFRAARFDLNGNKICNARLSVCHNGIFVHDDVELANKTGAGAKEGTNPLPIKFQNHGNPVHFRNIWIVDHSPAYHVCSCSCCSTR